MEYLNKNRLLKKIEHLMEDKELLLYVDPATHNPENGDNIIICHKQLHNNTERKFYEKGRFLNGKYYVYDKRFCATSPSGDEGYHYEEEIEVTDNVLGWFQIPEIEEAEEVKLLDSEFVDFKLEDFVSCADVINGKDNIAKLSDYFMFTLDFIDLIKEYYKGNYSESRIRFELSLLCKKYYIENSSSKR